MQEKHTEPGFSLIRRRGLELTSRYLHARKIFLTRCCPTEANGTLSASNLKHINLLLAGARSACCVVLCCVVLCCVVLCCVVCSVWALMDRLLVSCSNSDS